MEERSSEEGGNDPLSPALHELVLRQEEEEERSPPSEEASSLPISSANEEPRFLLAGEEVGRRKTVALASYPRSGNSLLRSLLERMTGFITGSDSRPTRDLSRKLAKAGLKGEGVVEPDKVWIVKTHFPERLGWKPFKAEKVILLVRNPFDCIDSYFNMALTRTHTDSIAESEYDRLKELWTKRVEEEAEVWHRFHDYWHRTSAHSQVPMLVVRYEDLLLDRKSTLCSIAAFLQDVSNGEVYSYEQRLGQMLAEETEQQNKGNVYKPRVGGIGKSLKHYSLEQRQLVLRVTFEQRNKLGYTDEFFETLPAFHRSPEELLGAEEDQRRQQLERWKDEVKRYLFRSTSGDSTSSDLNPPLFPPSPTQPPTSTKKVESQNEDDDKNEPDDEPSTLPTTREETGRGRGRGQRGTRGMKPRGRGDMRPYGQKWSQHQNMRELVLNRTWGVRDMNEEDPFGRGMKWSEPLLGTVLTQQAQRLAEEEAIKQELLLELQLRLYDDEEREKVEEKERLT
ncbi:Fbox domain containing protein [Balamuthia mandrillaris]